MPAPPAIVDLSDRAKFRLSGPDRVRYLNGQVTNNVARLRSGETCYALVCTHKGKIEADVFIRAAEDDALLIDGPGELREPLFARLGKYLIADDCEIEDVTEEYALWHELDPGGKPDERGPAAATGVNRFGVPGRDVWAALPAEAPTATLAGAALDLLRLEHAIPAWGAELTPNTLPQEARLQDRAVDFAKGCYIGQEVISRLKSVGHVTRDLRALETTPGAGPVQAGDRLFAGDDLAEAGWVTSAAWHPGLEKTIALGYVKSTLVKSGTVFRAGKDKNALSSAVMFRNTSPDPIFCMKKHGYSLLLAAALGCTALVARGQDAPAVPAAPAEKPPEAEDAAATPVVPRDTSPPAPAEKKPAPAAKPAKSSDNPLSALTGRKKKSPGAGPALAPASSFPDAAGSDAVLFTILVNDDKERFVIKLRPDMAPKTVANFKKNIESGFYNGLAFHRVIRNYLVQTGDPLSKDDAQKEQWGTTDVGQDISGEFGGKHNRYAVAMAHKAGQTTSSGSQFYIMLRPASNLDGSYAVFGEVTSGTDVLNRLSGVIVDTNDAPLKRLEIVDAKLISSTAKLALEDGPSGRRKTKPDSQKGLVEKFVERVW